MPRGTSWLWLVCGLAAAPFLLFMGARGVIALASARLELRYRPPGRLVAVDGHNLHIYCMGSGDPVIVLELGMGSDWVAWRPVISKLAAQDEVCVYDRAGYGWSDSGPMPRTALRIATELHELLTKSQIPGPYLLLAHSFGGYIARMYADRFPDSLRGIVMVDPLQEEDGHDPDPAPRFTFSIRGLACFCRRWGPTGSGVCTKEKAHCLSS